LVKVSYDNLKDQIFVAEFIGFYTFWLVIILPNESLGRTMTSRIILGKAHLDHRLSVAKQALKKLLPRKNGTISINGKNQQKGYGNG